VSRSTPCPCRSPLLALDRIEGREDDVLWLLALNGAGTVPVFGDVIAHVLVRTLPGIQDYSLDEIEQGRWRMGLAPSLDGPSAARLQKAIAAMAASLGAAPPRLEIGAPRVLEAIKRRRIRGARSACLPS
jgi:phenylacetate-coenzyme A ligase PaaK-like adenylate-forming protein